MCTYLTDFKIHTAKYPIRTYKLVAKADDKYYAPFRGQDYVYRPNIPATAHLQIILKKYKCSTGRYLSDVSYGIHSFTSLSSAIDYYYMIVRYSPNKQKEYAILESEVPEGAHYYEGHADFGHGLVDAVPDTIVSDILIPRDNEIDLKCEKYDISFAQDIN